MESIRKKQQQSVTGRIHQETSGKQFLEFLGSLDEVDIQYEKNWKRHATSSPYTMNQIEAEKHMRMT